MTKELEETKTRLREAQKECDAKDAALRELSAKNSGGGGGGSGEREKGNEWRKVGVSKDELLEEAQREVERLNRKLEDAQRRLKESASQSNSNSNSNMNGSGRRATTPTKGESKDVRSLRLLIESCLSSFSSSSFYLLPSLIFLCFSYFSCVYGMIRRVMRLQTAN